MSTITALTPHVGVEVVGVSGHGFVSADVAAECEALLREYAYESLSDDDKALIADLQVEHSFAAGRLTDRSTLGLRTMSLR